MQTIKSPIKYLTFGRVTGVFVLRSFYTVLLEEQIQATTNINPKTALNYSTQGWYEKTIMVVRGLCYCVSRERVSCEQVQTIANFLQDNTRLHDIWWLTV